MPGRRQHILSYLREPLPRDEQCVVNLPELLAGLEDLLRAQGCIGHERAMIFDALPESLAPTFPR